MPTRRKVLNIIGGGAVVAASGAAGFAGFSATRQPAKALLPWQQAGATYADPLRRALSFAVLAPNPHNRQPWVVDLRTDGEAVLYCDPDRRLPETDPFDRQIVIGLGCFAEIFALAAGADGRRAEIVPFPAGGGAPRLDDRPVARLRLAPAGAATPDPLAAAILDRRTCKEPFDTSRPVAPGALAQILAVAAPAGTATGGTIDAAATDRLRDIAWRAFEIEIRTPRTYQESVDLMRIGKQEIEASPDGIDLGGPMLEILAMAGLLTRETLADPASQAFASGIARYRDIIGTAAGFAWIATPGNNRGDQFAAGRAFVRQQLAGTLAGVAVHPLSQALQEYPEMEAIRAEVDAAIGIEPSPRLQMLSRIGHARPADTPLPPSPRWPLETRLRTV